MSKGEISFSRGEVSGQSPRLRATRSCNLQKGKLKKTRTGKSTKEREIVIVKSLKFVTDVNRLVLIEPFLFISVPATKGVA